MTDFGCDRCGYPESEHDEEHGNACPQASMSSRYQKWQPPMRWVDDGHELHVNFVYGKLQPRLVCPHATFYADARFASSAGFQVRDIPGCLQRVCPGCEGAKTIKGEKCPDCDGEGSLRNEDLGCGLVEWINADEDGFLDLAEQWMRTVSLPTPILWYADPDQTFWRPKVATRG